MSEREHIVYLTGHLTGRKLAHVDLSTRRLVIIERGAHGQKIVNTFTEAELLALFHPQK